jgi:hypothetical protein
MSFLILVIPSVNINVCAFVAVGATATPKLLQMQWILRFTTTLSGVETYWAVGVPSDPIS